MDEGECGQMGITGPTDLVPKSPSRVVINIELLVEGGAYEQGQLQKRLDKWNAAVKALGKFDNSNLATEPNPMTDDLLRADLTALSTGKRPVTPGDQTAHGFVPLSQAEKDEIPRRVVAEVGRRGSFDWGGARWVVRGGELKREVVVNG